MGFATHPATPPFTPSLPPSSSSAVYSEPSQPLNSPETTSSRHSSDRSDASSPSSVAFTDSSTSASSSPLAPSCSSSATPDSRASRDSSDALPPNVAVKDGKCSVHDAYPPTQSPGNTSARVSFREKLFVILRLAREYIRHPPRLPILVNAVVIVTMACGVFALLTGIYRVAFTSDDKRADLLEFSTQVLQAAGTVAALLLHPTRLVYLLRLVRWRPADVISLRKVFSRGDAAVAKPHERRHMAVVIGLLNIACVSQYGIFLCLCLRAPADRRIFPVLVFIFGAFGLGTVAGVYFLLCPLGRPLPAERADGALPAAPEAHKRSAGSADADRSTARGSPAEKARACGLWEISSRGRGDGGEERGSEGSERRARARVVRALFLDEESGEGDSREDDGNSDDADSSSSGGSSNVSDASSSSGSGGSSITDRYRHIQRTESHIEACPPLALPSAAMPSHCSHSSPSCPSFQSCSALSCHLGSSPDHHPSLRLGSARLQSSRSQRSSSCHVDKRAVWQPRAPCAGAAQGSAAAQGAAAISDAPEWAGSLWGAADDCGITARVAFCCPCAFAWHLQRAGFGHPLFHSLNLLLFLLGPPLVFTASARFMTNPALHALTVAFGVAGALMGLLYGGYWRWKLRRTFDLPAQTWMCGHKAFSDFGAWVACPCCALCQEMRTVKAYGLRVVAPDAVQLEVFVTGGKGGVRSGSKSQAEQDSVTISFTMAPSILKMEIDGNNDAAC